MTAMFESPRVGPEFDLDDDLPGALREGLGRLHIEASPRGLARETVGAVFEKAFSPFHEFLARQENGYLDVVELSLEVNGWAWTEACVVETACRRAEFRAVEGRALGYAAKHFPALHKHDRRAVVEDLLYLELSGDWIHSWAHSAHLPGWMIPGIVFRRLGWRLLDAKRELVDRPRAIGGAAIHSWEHLTEMSGERDTFVRPLWHVPVDDAGVEAVVWAAAGARLAASRDDMIGRARAGATRERAILTVESATWVLATGSQDAVGGEGTPVAGSAEEIRQAYAQDPLLVCFRGLRAASPAKWGAYPDGKVPTREVIERVAAEASARCDVNAGWFAKLEARRTDVAKSDRVLHGSRRLVETLLEEAAHDPES